MVYESPNATNFVEWMQYNNSVTCLGGECWFGVAILIMLYVVVIVSLKQFDISEGMATAGFITSISAILLRVLGLVSSGVVIAFVMLAIIGVVYLFIKGTKS